ncbi:uncharacterized protein LOC144922119 [Branchiostoma floridae x Branchiostoma belcheri]
MTESDVGFQDNTVNEMRETALPRTAPRDPDLRDTVKQVRTRLRQQIRINRRVLHQLKRQRENQWKSGYHSEVPFLIRSEDSVVVRIMCLGLVCVVVYILTYIFT